MNWVRRAGTPPDDRSALPTHAPISWPLRKRLIVFGRGGLLIAVVAVAGTWMRRGDAGQLYTKSWYWVDATPYLTAVPVMIVTAAVGFALLVPLYRHRRGGIAVGLALLTMLAIEYTVFARTVGPLWQGPAFERWQLPLLAAVMVAVAVTAALAVRDWVLGAERRDAGDPTSG